MTQICLHFTNDIQNITETFLIFFPVPDSTKIVLFKLNLHLFTSTIQTKTHQQMTPETKNVNLIVSNLADLKQKQSLETYFTQVTKHLFIFNSQWRHANTVLCLLPRVYTHYKFVNVSFSPSKGKEQLKE